MARRRPHDRRVGTLIILMLVLGFVAPAIAYPGAPWFFPGGEYDQNFPDPHVIHHDGVYYAYATNTGGPRLPSMTSIDLETWVAHDVWGANPWSSDPFYNDALVRVPSWADGWRGHEVWAPAVEPVGDGWRAYYAIRESSSPVRRFCISVASAPGPLGPFEDVSREPLTCGDGPAGAIDPWLHVDDAGRRWLLWKSEPVPQSYIDDLIAEYEEAEEEIPEEIEELEARGAAIWSQPLTGDGLRLAPGTEAALLLEAGGGWEAGNVENPALVELGGTLVLFYSGNRWDTAEYATSWAVCRSVTGPCFRGEDTPFLARNGDVFGPGGASVFRDAAGETRIAYHAWNAPYSWYPPFPECDVDGDLECADQGQRFLHVDLLCWLPQGQPHIGVPTDASFCDVPTTTWMTEPVAWMADERITTGVSPHHFAPDRPVSRAEAVTFLWRFVGSPEPVGAAPFEDLHPGSFYEAATVWAFENGVINGTSATTFSPEDTLTRAQMALILHRAAALAPAAEPAGFDDVPAGVSFAAAVDWLAATGITTGTTSVTFSPGDPVTRAQMAAFLCRYSASVEPGAGETAALFGAGTRCEAT
ncbi:MAG: S-layer homology domain-containing protein [Actinomycetota bacterium]